MIPSKRQKLRAVHEAGHAAVALRFGMLGDGEINILEDENQGGSTPIHWSLGDLKDPFVTKQRAAVSMAGVAADFDLRQEEGQVDIIPLFTAPDFWHSIFFRCEDLRPDIKRTCQLHFISQNPELAWEEVKRTRGANPNATEDEILDAVTSMPAYGEPNYENVQEYFEAARTILSGPHPKRFMEEASQYLFAESILSCSRSSKIWRNSRTEDGLVPLLPNNPGSDIPFELYIGIDDDVRDPEGFISTDSCSELMEEFFRILGIAYPRIFISLWVCPVPNDSSSATVKLRRDSLLACLYGRQYRLKHEYFDRVAIVGSGDFLNIMSKAIAEYLRSGELVPNMRTE